MNAPSIAAPPSDDLSLQAADPLLAPALFQALFWKPRFMTQSPVTVHVPLLYWLSCALRPRRVAILGAGDGMAHFAFCQALEHLGTASRCQSFGFWGSAEDETLVPGRLSEHQEMLYDGLSELVACPSLDDALDRVKPNTVDLLFCDLLALPGDVQMSCETLLGYLSRPSLLLLHGTNRAKEKPPADFRGLNRVLAQHRHVEFPEEDGLILVCGGGDLPAPLQMMFDMAPGGRLRRDVEQVFRRSGRGLRAIAAQTAQTRARQHAEEAVLEAQSALQQMQGEVLDLRRQLEDLARTILARTAERDAEQKIRFEGTETLARIAEDLRNNLKDTEAALEERTRERDTARSEAEAMRKAQGETAAGQARAEAALTSAQANAEAAKAEHQAERHTRFEETAALTRIAEDLRRQMNARSEAANTQLQAEKQAKLDQYTSMNGIAEDLRRKLREAARQKEQLQRHNQELLESTSWRITAPMRAIKTGLGLGLRRNGK